MKNLALVGMTCAILAGCATERPVLYPNGHARDVGRWAADRDVDDCMLRGEQYVNGLNRPDAIIEETITGSAGLPAPLMHDSAHRRDPGLLFRSFVNRCLRQRGYEPLVWKPIVLGFWQE